ncbi:site-specific DNA-methyltransferase [Parageobacillus sp. G301]|uniref:site-specific DNA-methyltransferase n=1 Tax=Parageobacillus sp. G301 TaxID=2998290 RepID=UPI0024998419|nr:site-specific DNA-methyltransferase [Parageobacillus sp. G301]GLH64490.1 site-specific DNA-methyltransferase [Parageobacillus sp. G301]
MYESYEKLKSILKEMFQLDQSELDFGIYRIMNYKRQEIEKFLNEDLLPQVRKELEKYVSVERKGIEKELKELIKRLEEDGVPLESSTKYLTLKSKLDNGLNIASAENEVYSHLANFFRRYYNNGDFISLRRYKKDVYALPYEGEEVKLHWANADQYYIKTAEYFRDYSFTTPDGKKVHFKLVEAETERDNNKVQKGKERRFVLYKDEPLVEENGELIIKFEYVIHEKKQKELIDEAIEFISKKINTDAFLSKYQTLFVLQPTEKNPKRTLLEKYLNDYTSRNTFDYFIHKDLGGFLRRELDFYIKNEVMFLDDLDTENEVKIEQYITKIKVIKKIGDKIITFLEQIENFQKKLWLKKKFVTETNYCITLDRIPEELYPEIISNKEQINEWKRLFAIDELEGYKEPLTVDFLKQNPYLVLDTRFFNEKFKEYIIDSIENLDNEIDGLLVQADNFQALNLLQTKYSGQIKCIYIDPPYNTGSDGFLYKDNYKHSSWMSFIADRVKLSRNFLGEESLFFSSIGDQDDENRESIRLTYILDEIFGSNNYIENIVWKKKYGGGAKTKYFVGLHEYILCYAKNKREIKNIQTPPDTESLKYYKYKDEKYEKRGPYRLQPLATNSMDERPNLRYPIMFNGEEIWPEKQWQWSKERTELALRNNEIVINKKADGNYTVNFKQYLKDENGEIRKSKPFSIIDGVYTQHGTIEIKNMFGDGQTFSFPKPSKLIEGLISIFDTDITVLDYFAGSGTTAHAVINLNRQDGKKRKYILIEMGDYFDSVLIPRIQKIIYSKDWKGGKPVSREGSSHIFKYIRLESYEDTLNNLVIQRKDEQISLLEQYPELREQYMLSYMLNNETENSMSLLNIDQFKNPFNYKLKIAKGLETKVTTIDLVETFNYLLGLEVVRNTKKERYNAVEDKNSNVPGAVKLNSADDGEYIFKQIEGRTLSGEKILLIWRTLTDDIVKDNAVLDAYFLKKRHHIKDFDFDKIYVNGDNNLQNLKLDNEKWKVFLIEEEFKKLMFDVQDV